ncbi:MAG: hypothetical protein ACXV5J_14900 [Candidatus Angelobacter sp.]
MQIEIESFHHWGESLCENYYAMNRAEVEEGDKIKEERILAAGHRRETQISKN